MEGSREQRTKLLEAFPWVEHPLISNAPMSGYATSDLAAAVSRSGGLGQIGFTGHPLLLQRELELAREKLQTAGMDIEAQKVLPVGVGIIVFGNSAKPWIQVFREYKPAMAWLSFGTGVEFRLWADHIRAVSPDTKIWIQVGSVEAAMEAAMTCSPDALVLQGSDAGGHGHKHGASIVSLIPETSDALQQQGLSRIPVVAAGGIMDQRGVAAAIALGASGVVMGTRFLACDEIDVGKATVDKCLAAYDGGEATVRSRVFDDVRGRNSWPQMYDGRCLRNAVYDKVEESGMTIKDVRRCIISQIRGDDESNSDLGDVSSIWAGTGVGLLKKKEAASDIVEEVRREARCLMRNIAARA